MIRPIWCVSLTWQCLWWHLRRCCWSCMPHDMMPVYYDIDYHLQEWDRQISDGPGEDWSGMSSAVMYMYKAQSRVANPSVLRPRGMGSDDPSVCVVSRARPSHAKREGLMICIYWSCTSGTYGMWFLLRHKQQNMRASSIWTTAPKMEPRSGLKAVTGTSIQAIFSLACCLNEWNRMPKGMWPNVARTYEIFVGVKRRTAPIPHNNQQNLLFHKL